MEVINQKKQDREMLLVMHLSQLLNLITGFGGIIVPVILWQLKKDEIEQMDEQGKEVVNFQISLFIYLLVGGVLAVILIGFLVLAVVAIIGLIFPIINGIKAKDGNPINYPFTIKFIQ